MNTLHFDLCEKHGKFKILNAVNNGPHHRRHNNSQFRSNLAEYKAARIPYARNHDASFYWTYGREHTVDISAIFPNFDADVNDPASYDFACTDEYIGATLDAGTETFYRLGQTIEHYIKKYYIYPPADFKKWAEICEHIIRHYNEGWADGFYHNIQYWEIWNEPDLHSEEEIQRRNTWGGTMAQFFDFYEIAAKHLKSSFPHLKIGGPALAGNTDWAEDFLKEMQCRNVPLDFFSWHKYGVTPQKILKRAEIVRKLLDCYGYENAESILNEWNYIRGWRDDFVYSIQSIKGIKGAAFTMAVMCVAQPSDIDMLMYYDARPTEFNGLFDTDTVIPLKGYYPFLWYGNFYDMTAEIRTKDEIEDIYTLCGVDEKEKVTAIITYYTEEDDTATDKTVSLDFGREGEYEIYLLDADHDGEMIEVTSDLTFTMKPLSVIMIREK